MCKYSNILYFRTCIQPIYLVKNIRSNTVLVILFSKYRKSYADFLVYSIFTYICISSQIFCIYTSVFSVFLFASFLTVCIYSCLLLDVFLVVFFCISRCIFLYLQWYLSVFSVFLVVRDCLSVFLVIPYQIFCISSYTFLYFFIF